MKGEAREGGVGATLARREKSPVIDLRRLPYYVRIAFSVHALSITRAIERSRGCTITI